jgi:hypothetical protein
VLFLALLLPMVGCHYQVIDRQTGRAYYAEGWVATDGYRGPLTFTDLSGQKHRLRDAAVIRLSRDDFDQALQNQQRARERE